MNRSKKSGFTLVEIIVVIGIIGILTVALSRVATIVRGNASIKATQGIISQVVDALQAYADSDPGRNRGAVDFPKPFNSDKVPFDALDRRPQARAVINAISDEYKSGSSPNIIINDVWDMPLLYEYESGSGNFPVIISAGPDKKFGTPDDIISSQF